MTVEPQVLARFREQLRQARDADPEAWTASRRLVGQPHLQSTLTRLAAAIQGSALPLTLREALIGALRGAAAGRVQSLPGEALRHLTGLPPAKAVRALCVQFGVTDEAATAFSISALTSEQVERFVRGRQNAYDLLLEADVASLLDLGAGDLSFASEVVEQYLPRLRAQGKDLILHCLDRLQTGSRLGGRLHADPDRLQKLRQPTPGLQFQFWGNQDMFELEKVKRAWPCYTIATCCAPATPTFAYEPSRISRPIIDAHLRKTKGEFRRVRVDGEEALEVFHEGRALLFPPWKFEIKGPLALLDLLSRRGKLGILSAVDAEVFWEILSQLLADPTVRPPDVVFRPSIIAELFGSVHATLSTLRVGQSVVLSELANLRQDIPRVLAVSGPPASSYRFRYVEIRRGAVFETVPAGHTARLFTDMREEAPPWFLVLVPEDRAVSSPS